MKILMSAIVIFFVSFVNAQDNGPNQETLATNNLLEEMKRNEPYFLNEVKKKALINSCPWGTWENCYNDSNLYAYCESIWSHNPIGCVLEYCNTYCP